MAVYKGILLSQFHLTVYSMLIIHCWLCKNGPKKYPRQLYLPLRTNQYRPRLFASIRLQDREFLKTLRCRPML